MTREDRMLRASLACLSVAYMLVLGAALGVQASTALVFGLAAGLWVTCCLAMMADGR